MKVTLPVFRIPRRLASEVLSTAATKTAAGASESEVLFNELPDQLKRFFQKYPPKPFREYSEKPTATNAPDANPFLANKHPVTNRWHEPKYSMRQQADLYKAAYRFGIQGLLPNLLHNRKFYEEKYAEGVTMRGAHLFKLTKSERKAPARAQEVREAVADLDNKIAERKGRRFKNFLAKKNGSSYA